MTLFTILTLFVNKHLPFYSMKSRLYTSAFVLNNIKVCCYFTKYRLELSQLLGYNVLKNPGDNKSCTKSYKTHLI